MNIAKNHARRIRAALNLFAVITMMFSFCMMTSVNGENLSASELLMPEADLFVKCDMADLRESQIVQELEKIKEEEGESLAEGALNFKKSDELEELGKEIQEMTGLKKEDLLGFVIAADFDDIDWDNPEDAQNFNGVAAVNLAKPLSLDQLEEALRKTASMRDEDKPMPEFSRSEIGGQEVLVVDNNGDAAEEESGSKQDAQLYFTSVANEKTILVGTETGINDAVSRIGQEDSGAVEDEFPGWAVKEMEDEHLSVLFKFTPEMRSRLAEQVEENAGSGQDGQSESGQKSHKEAFLKVIPQLQTVKLGMNFTDVIDGKLQGEMGDADGASQLQQLLQNPVISMTQVTLMFLTGGQNLPFANSLGAGIEDDVRASLSFQVSMKDIDILREASAENADQENPLVPDQEEENQQ
ncbi:MAG: hypothetical protein ACOCQP_01380 [Lentisphaeria bacterium]